jgi:hypothetical protein
MKCRLKPSTRGPGGLRQPRRMLEVIHGMPESEELQKND